MKRSTVYLILQAVVCCVLAALLSASAISIWRDGMARRAIDPMAEIFTPQIVTAGFAPVMPLCFLVMGLLIAGLALGVRDERADAPVKDAELARDLIVARVNCPSEAMRRERTAQKRLNIIGWSAFALCMAPVALYLIQPEHFTLDLERMFQELMRVLLPWTAVGLGVLAATAALGERHVCRETEAAKAQLQAERAEGLSAAMPVETPKRRGFVQVAILVVAVALILAGIFNGSAQDVLYKAITICTECVGLG